MRVTVKEALFCVKNLQELTTHTVEWLQRLKEEDFEVEEDPGRTKGGPAMYQGCLIGPTAQDYERMAALAVVWARLLGIRATR